jgi:hypothetical protein
MRLSVIVLKDVLTLMSFTAGLDSEERLFMSLGGFSGNGHCI